MKITAIIAMLLVSQTEGIRVSTETQKDENNGFQTGGSQGVTFQLKSRQNRNRVMVVDNSPIEEGVGVHTKHSKILLRAPENTSDEFWYYDTRDTSIHSTQSSNYVLNLLKDQVVRSPVEGAYKALKATFYYDKETHSLKVDGKCAQAANEKEDSEVKVAACNNELDSQKWYPFYDYQTEGPHWNKLQNE